jgi:hypothetical protein
MVKSALLDEARARARMARGRSEVVRVLMRRLQHPV